MSLQKKRGVQWRNVWYLSALVLKIKCVRNVWYLSALVLKMFQVSQDLDESYFFWWVTFKSLKTWMSHFQVSRDLDESLSSLSRLGWVIFKSLETWMSHFQVSQDLDESLSSLARLWWGLERRGTGSLSSRVTGGTSAVDRGKEGWKGTKKKNFIFFSPHSSAVNWPHNRTCGARAVPCGITGGGGGGGRGKWCN